MQICCQYDINHWPGAHKILDPNILHQYYQSEGKDFSIRSTIHGRHCNSMDCLFLLRELVYMLPYNTFCRILLQTYMYQCTLHVVRYECLGHYCGQIDSCSTCTDGAKFAVTHEAKARRLNDVSSRSKVSTEVRPSHLF